MAGVSLTWNATANLRVAWKGNTIFFDPWFTRNDKAEPRIQNTIDFVDDGASIFMSHGHFDHLQDVPAILMAKGKVNVYCSPVARSTVELHLKAREGVDPSRIEGCMARVHAISAGDTMIHAGGDMMVEAIKSEHIRFDARSILRVLFNLEAWKNIKALSKAIKGYPKGDVFGYEIRFGNEGRLVFFGSLCNKYPDILKKHGRPDILVLPIAGRFNCDEIGLEVTRIISPKIVVPVHHDNFFPPVSYWTPVAALKDGAGKLDPAVRYLELVPGQEETVALG